MIRGVWNITEEIPKDLLGNTHVNERKVQVGILGLGFGGKGHVPAYRGNPDIKLVALGCTKAGIERGKEIANQFDIPLIFTDFHKLVVSQEVDLVSIAVPPFLHYPVAVEALKAGKHVLCEKPMALDIKEARDMLRLAEETKKICMIDFEFRFLPSRRKMKTLIDGGYLGETYCVNVNMFFDYNASSTDKPWNWLSQREKGGGILGAIGSHYIDLLLWMFGDIVEVSGRLDTFVEHRYLPGSTEAKEVETEDSFAFLCKFSNGAQGVAHFCSVSNQGIGIRSGVGLARIEAYGTEGTLILNSKDQLFGARHGNKELEEIPIDQEGYTGEVPVFLQRQRRCLEALIKEMINNIRDGKQMPPSFVDGVKCQEVMDALRLSDVRKSWVPLPLQDKKQCE